MNLYELIKKHRNEQRISQKKLAQKLGVDRMTICLWETNKVFPRKDHLQKLCEILSLELKVIPSNANEITQSKHTTNDQPTTTPSLTQ